MKTLYLCLAFVLYTVPALAQSPFDEPRLPSLTEQFPGALHNDQSFPAAIIERNRQMEEQAQRENLERQNRQLRKELEWQQRYNRADKRERESMELFKSIAP